MAVSLALLSGFSPGLEPQNPPIDAALSGDELVQLLYASQPSEFEAQLPVPVPGPDFGAQDQPQQDQELTGSVSEPWPDTQQWLNVMLDQQAVQLQARDYTGGSLSDLNSGRFLPRMPPETGSQGPEPQVLKAQHSPIEPGADNEALGEQPVLVLDKLQQLVSRVLPSVSTKLTTSESGLTAAPGPVEQLPSIEVAVATPVLAGSAATSGPVLERGLKLAAPEARWGEQMLYALRETVEVQVQQRFQQATIRLDPPELGSLEIFISHESGRLTVHISAAQTDVARLLASTSERLRQELVEQNNVQVHVQVSSDSQGHSQRDQGRPSREPAIADAIQDAQLSSALLKQRDSGVLVTV